MPRDLHELPKLRDSLSYLYIEHAVIEQEDSSIVIIRKDERIPVPVASLTVLFIGPGTSITHAAIKAICDNGCMAIWCGEHTERFYAYGMGETRSASNLISQARLNSNSEKHIEVVCRMYERRFPGISCKELTLRQIRGLEGVRVRETYRLMSKQYGVKWNGRVYKNEDWNASDTVNRALSAANACLYGLCNAAIVSLGYSPGLGFIHTGKMLSFVYDIADLYKALTTIPVAFEIASSSGITNIERETRLKCRQAFKNQRLLKKIPEDIQWIFDIPLDENEINSIQAGELWDDEDSTVAGGINYANED